MRRFRLLLLSLVAVFPVLTICQSIEIRADPPAQFAQPADLIVHNGKVLTVDARFCTAQAVAIRGEKITAVGDDKTVLEQRGPKTVVIDAHGKTVMPGLYDSHTHPVDAAMSEVDEPIPVLDSLEDVFTHIRKKTQELPRGEWIVMRFAFPTRLKDGRFPTKAELDAAAPEHPVHYNAGPAGMANSYALKISKITKDTPNPRNGIIVKDPATGEPTGMLRGNSAQNLLVGRPSTRASTADRKEAVRKLFALYNEHGITSVADRAGSRGNLNVYQALHKAGQLTVRVNMAQTINPFGSREEIAQRLDGFIGKDKLGGPTGVGGIWIRIGPIKFFLDGGMLNGTAYMRQPWPKGPTYQIVEDNYRGLLFVPPDQVKILIEEATRRHWQVTAHTAGEGAMDVLLDAYDHVNRIIPIKEMRHCITHANFPSQQNLERCQRLGVCADVQPAWLFKDGATLAKVLGPERIRWFQPYKSWLKYTTIGGGSDHMIKLDPRQSTNPWDPWLSIAVCLTRRTERGPVVRKDEALSREEALKLYTINNAYLHHEEKEKGSLEVGKLGDLIIIDRDYLTCPVEEVARIKVLTTVVGGKVVYQRKEAKTKARSIELNESVPAGQTVKTTRKLYVINTAGNDVTVADVATNKVIGRIEVGPHPHGIAASAKGDLLLVTVEGGKGELVWIDPKTDTVVRRLPAGPAPNQLAVTPDGKFAYVPVSGGKYLVVDVPEAKVIDKIVTGGSPHNTLCSADGRHMYLAPLGGKKRVTIVDVASRKVLGDIQFSGSVRPITITSDEKKFFAQVDGLVGIEMADVASRKMVHRVPATVSPELKKVGSRSHGIGVRPGDKEVWCCDVERKVVHVFDITSDLPKQVATIPIGGTVYWLTFDPEGRYCYVSALSRNEVAVVDTNSREVVARIPVGKNPKRLLVVDVPQ